MRLIWCPSRTSSPSRHVTRNPVARRHDRALHVHRQSPAVRPAQNHLALPCLRSQGGAALGRNGAGRGVRNPLPLSRGHRPGSTPPPQRQLSHPGIPHPQDCRKHLLTTLRRSILALHQRGRVPPAAIAKPVAVIALPRLALCLRLSVGGAVPARRSRRRPQLQSPRAAPGRSRTVAPPRSDAIRRTFLPTQHAGPLQASAETEYHLLGWRLLGGSAQEGTPIALHPWGSPPEEASRAWIATGEPHS